MNRTPGYIIPSEFPNVQTAIEKLHEVDKAAGFTTLDQSLFHSSDIVDEFLAHYGVLGMHWGVRKERTADDVRSDLAKIEKSRNSIARKILPGSAVLTGAGAQAGSAKKILKLKEVPNIDGSGKRLVPSDKSPTITAANRAHFEKKIDRRSYRHYTTTGAVAVAGLLGAAYLGKSLNDPELAKLVTKGALALAGAQALHTTTITAGVHRNIKDREINAKETALKKELKTLS